MKHTLQKAAVIGMAAMTLFAFAACGEKQELVLDPSAAADTLLNEITFDTELADAGEAAAGILFTLPEGVTAAVYAGDGAYADELVIFDCGSRENVAAAQEAAEAHLADLKESFADYIPEEAEKVDSAVMETAGSYLILCVSDDENAAAAVQAVLK